MVLLISNDGFTVEVDEVDALQSRFVKFALEKSKPEQGIPLENVGGEVLFKIAEYMTKQSAFDLKKPQEIAEKSPELQDDVAKAEEALKEWKKEVEIWEEKYMNVSMDELYDLYFVRLHFYNPLVLHS
jgi:Skp1 family, tetramerisation domain